VSCLSTTVNLFHTGTVVPLGTALNFRGTCSKHSNPCRTWVLTVARCEFNAYLTLWGCWLARSSLGDPMLERFSGSYESILFGPCPLVIPLYFISNPTNYSTITCLINCICAHAVINLSLNLRRDHIYIYKKVSNIFKIYIYIYINCLISYHKKNLILP